jgi:hypothetical protein
MTPNNAPAGTVLYNNLGCPGFWDVTSSNFGSALLNYLSITKIFVALVFGD